MNNRDVNALRPRRALAEQGKIRCPRCGRLLARACAGAEASGLELWCGGKGCRMPVLVEF